MSMFEGPEKKLEIDFLLRSNGQTQHAPYPPRASNGLLRTVARSEWDRVCALVSCSILSVRRNEHFDAYVLSESSLFVYPQKVLIKTCGTTTLLACVGALIEIAKKVGLEVEAASYSRQRFHFPDKQPFPHQSFADETARLNELLPRSGDSYCLGELNGDHWYLYMLDEEKDKPSELRQDRTTEVFMKGLDEKIMRLFFSEAYDRHGVVTPALIDAAFPPPSETGARVHAALEQALAEQPNASSSFLAEKCIRALLNLEELFPGIQLDDHVFEPCGYSVNGMLDAVYLTIHVTPEPGYSFVSFETNDVQLPPRRVLLWAAAALRPGRLALALFADGMAGEGSRSRRTARLRVPHYRVRASTHYEFFTDFRGDDDDCEGVAPYDVLYVNFERCSADDDAPSQDA